jgi:hypothetical protein
MVDPVTILAVFCAIINTSHTLYKWYHDRQDRKLGYTSDVENKLFDGFMRLWSKYNRIASVMGRSFQLCIKNNGMMLLIAPFLRIGQ